MQEAAVLDDTARDGKGVAAAPIKPELTDLSDLVSGGDRAASPFGSEVNCTRVLAEVS